jgi:hypothetical protein
MEKSLGATRRGAQHNTGGNAIAMPVLVGLHHIYNLAA